MVRLKQPNLSPANESEPHCSTTADGRNTSRTRVMTLTGMSHWVNIREIRCFIETHRFKNASERFIRYSVFKRHVNRVSFPLPSTFIVLAARPRKVLSELVETTCHNAVRRVESFLYSISVMAVDIDVQDSWVCSEKFQSSKDDVVDITKSRSLPLFGMVQPSCPVNRNICCS